MARRYSEDIDYLVASVLYLGTHTYWWARSPRNLATELGLDEQRLRAVFDGFPGLFRRSVSVSDENGQPFYALQARYAQKEGGDTEEPEEAPDIAPLSSAQIELLTDFIIKMAEIEKSERRAVIGTVVAAGAAVISAATAVIVALLKA